MFNGGPIPPGYERSPREPGHLEINLEEAEVIKKCFDYFLVEETLSQTAKRLNDEGIKLLSRGNRIRNFRITNLYRILTNKTYMGVRSYTENGEEKEAKAVWKGIVNKKTFLRVGKLLNDNYRSKKPDRTRKYPYLLSGIIYCASCGDRLCGKTAHGKNGKFGYYEHTYKKQRDRYLKNKSEVCNSKQRFSAKKVHEIVEEKVFELLSNERFATRLLKSVDSNKDSSFSSEIKKFNLSLQRVDQKIDALTDRLSELPKGLSASSIYVKMEEFQKEKESLELRLKEKKELTSSELEIPAKKETWLKYLSELRKVFKTDLGADLKARMLKKIISKVEVSDNEIVIHYFVSEDHVNEELAFMANSSFFEKMCSNSLTNGGA